VHEFTLRGNAKRDYVYRDQIHRAAISVMTNVAEGFGRRSHGDFARFLDFARASAREVQSLLYLGRDFGYLEPEEFDILYNQAGKTASIITNLMRSLH
jgi:four helix bundle protein